MSMPGDAARRAVAGVLAIAALGCARATPTPEGAVPEAPPTAAQPSPPGDERSAVERDTMRDQSYSRIEELIEGRAPGVQVIRRPDGTFAFRIRGTSSPSGSNDPLLVIDGMTIQPSQVGAVLAALHPQDIVRIDVLKDAASTAFYGMRGANGVVVITTRRR
jgi:TonB-dependent SusC/RagA subfamily outer membrane receptor